MAVKALFKCQVVTRRIINKKGLFLFELDMNRVMPIYQPPSGKRGFPLRLFAVAFILSIIATAFNGWQEWQARERFEKISREHIAIRDSIGRIMLLDEALTMSARMVAATGDFGYEKR